MADVATCEHSRGRTLKSKVEGPGEPFAQSGFRRAPVQAHFPAEKSFGRKTAEDHVRIRDRGLAAAPAVTRRPRLGAGAAGTDVQAAAFVEPGDAAAAGSHFDDVEDGDADSKPFVIAADKIIRRETRLAAPNNAGLGRRPAHVESDGGLEIEQLAQRHGTDDASRGSRFHHLNALAARQLDIGQAAVGLHDQQITGKLIAPQTPFEIAQVLADLRPDVGVGGHGGGAFVFTIFPRQLMGGADK